MPDVARAARFSHNLRPSTDDQGASALLTDDGSDDL
jgi:hypothetical protein